MPGDTTADALKVQQQAWKTLGPAGRISAMIDLSEELRRLKIAGLASRFAELDEVELMRRYIEEVHGVVVPFEHGHIRA